jgi:hypothetical protein
VIKSKQCEQCGAPVRQTEGLLASKSWCSEECLSAWESADPERTEGWIRFADMTPEMSKKLMQGSGLALESIRPIGKAVLS